MEAIDKVKQMIIDGAISQENAEKYFPELKESEDEQIRKWLVEELYKSVNSSIITRDFDIYMGRKALAWLEKQKLVDKDDLDFAKRLNELRKVQREKNLDELIEMRWSVLKDVEKLTKEMFTRQAKFFFEVGYEKQGEQKPTDLPKGEDYDIDGLYAAVDILQKTLGKVEGYQTDDGILEHECAISAVKDLSKQKSAEWSEEDEKMFDYALDMIEWYSGKNENKSRLVSNWLKSLKDRVQPQPKQEWSEEDIVAIDCAVEVLNKDLPSLAASIERLKSLSPQKYSQINGAEMQKNLDTIFEAIDKAKDELGKGNIGAALDALYIQYSGIPIQSQWKPSDKQIKTLEKWLEDTRYKGDCRYVWPIFESLYNDLKKLKG